MCSETNCESLKQIIKYSAHAHNKSNIWRVNCDVLKAYSCVGSQIVANFQHKIDFKAVNAFSVSFFNYPY